jgi:hypothetical protein
MNPSENNSSIVIYQSKDGHAKLDVRYEDETVWLTQDQMAALYNKAKSTINEHFKNVYMEGELAEEAGLVENSEFPNFLPSRQTITALI